ncbi:alpha/beta hydrolase [soil metagenome]
MVRGVLVVVAVAGLVLALLWGFQRRLIYLPSGGPLPAAATVIDGAREVTLRTSDGLALGAWYVPAATLDAVTVLVANGNAGNRAARAPLARELSARGLGVLLFDYRGYGGNPGTPTQEGLAIDARVAYRFLVEDQGVAPGRLIYYGESLGAAVVTELATEHPPGGLLLRSPFTDLAAVGEAHYPFLPVRALLWDSYPLVEQIATIDVPTTVVYGERDSIVAPELSRAVASAAAGRTEVVAVPGADHNDAALLTGPELLAAVEQLADRVHG